MAPLTRFSVAPLHTMTRRLAAVASGRAELDLTDKGLVLVPQMEIVPLVEPA